MKGLFAVLLTVLASLAVFGQIPITGLPSMSTPPSGAEVFPLVQSGISKQGTLDQLLNQNFVAQILFPQTAAEVSAGVTPTYYYYQSLPTINILRYGCDPTGVTNSTTCFTNAIAVAAVSGGELAVPPGTYSLTSLTIANPLKITCEGGPGSVTLKETAATGDMFNITSANVLIQGCGFSSSVARTANAFVHWTSTSSSVTLRDFYMTGHYIGVQEECASECRVQSGLMYGGATSSGSAGIFVDGGNDQYIDQVTMDAPSGSQPAAGIQITDTGALIISNSDIIHHTLDLYVNPGNSQTVASLWVHHSFFDTATIGIDVVPTGTGEVIRSRFDNDWTSSNSQQGILVEAGGTATIDGLDIVDHHSFLNGTEGAIVQNSTGTSINVRFLGGAFVDNTQQGIAIGAGITKFSVIGVLSGSGFGLSGNGSWGILVSAGASANYTIAYNELCGNTSSQALSDGGTGSSKRISGNDCYNPIANAAISPTGSPFTWTNNTGDTVNLFVTGGTVSSVTNGGNTVATATNIVTPVPQGVSAVVTYSSTPTMSYTGY